MSLYYLGNCAVQEICIIIVYQCQKHLNSLLGDFQSVICDPRVLFYLKWKENVCAVLQVALVLNGTKVGVFVFVVHLCFGSLLNLSMF